MSRLSILPLTVAGMLICASLTPCRAQGAAQSFRYETQRVEGYLAERAAALAAALDFAGWPRTTELYEFPAVSRALLRDPAGVTEDVRACTTVLFDNEPWPQCTWSWKALTEGRRPSSEDWLDLQITVGPSGRAAQEYLIGSMADNMLPTDGLVAMYKTARRTDGPGHVAFLLQAPKGGDAALSFIRGNVSFRIRGHGTFAAEVLPLASRLDERLSAQQPLTLEELRARRPK